MLYGKFAQPHGRANALAYREIETWAGCIDDAPDLAEDHVQVLLQGTEGVSSPDGIVRIDRRIGPIRRVEIFSDEHTAQAQHRLLDKGLVLFDDSYKPIVHVFNALIGYEGSGPSLTKFILDQLSIPERIFDEIQRKFRGIRSSDVPYYIVIQSTNNDDSLGWEWSSMNPPVFR